MNRCFRLGKRAGTIFLISAMIWILGSCPLEAAQMDFPFITDEWVFLAECRPLPVEQTGTHLTEEEMDLLYKVVSMECDTGYEGSLAVISCMLNRQDSEKYPDDLIEVVKEDSQFTAYYDKETQTYPYRNREPSEECIAAVDDALQRGRRNIPSYILYFRSSDYDSLSGYETYGKIGDNTYFYLEEDR